MPSHFAICSSRDSVAVGSWLRARRSLAACPPCGPRPWVLLPGLWLVLWPAQGVDLTVPASAALALAVLAGIVWQMRVRAARRLQSAFEAYADREIARAQSRLTVRRGKPPPRVLPASPG